jgi:hypothetical protein
LHLPEIAETLNVLNFMKYSLLAGLLDYPIPPLLADPAIRHSEERYGTGIEERMTGFFHSLATPTPTILVQKVKQDDPIPNLEIFKSLSNFPDGPKALILYFGSQIGSNYLGVLISPQKVFNQGFLGEVSESPAHDS